MLVKANLQEEGKECNISPLSYYKDDFTSAFSRVFFSKTKPNLRDQLIGTGWPGAPPRLTWAQTQLLPQLLILLEEGAQLLLERVGLLDEAALLVVPPPGGPPELLDLRHSLPQAVLARLVAAQPANHVGHLFCLLLYNYTADMNKKSLFLWLPISLSIKS
jgi:hypothetical protein